MTDQLKRLGRIRLAVRSVLVLGILVSVAANILHAEPNPISQAIAAWAPLALLLAVELISGIPVHRRGRAWLRMSFAAVIAGIAAWVSYWHMVGVATRYGETGYAPYLLPISVDGLIVVASISLVETGNRIRQLEHHTSTGSDPADAGDQAATTNTTPEPATLPAPPSNSGAAVIPAATAARLAATFTPPAPATSGPATRNGNPSGNLAQEPLL